MKTFTPYYCPESFTDVILPADRITKDETNIWIIIGYPGVDGIEFRVKANENDPSIFAFYPIEEHYSKVADCDEELINKWKSGELTL